MKLQKKFLKRLVEGFFYLTKKYRTLTIDVYFLSDCYYKTNILFQIDTSMSIGSDGFAKSKDFIKKIAEYFNLETTDIAIMDFAATSKLQIPFKTNRKESELKSLIKEISYKAARGHSINNAFQRARDYFNAHGENRRTAQFLIIITAAQPYQVMERTTAAFWPQTLETLGVKTFIVGAGSKVTQKELMRYSSGEKFVFKSNDFDDIIGSVGKIRKSICSLARFY